MSLTRRLLHAAVFTLLAPLALLSAHAQDKPTLKIVVGFPPGGSADTLARLIGEQLRDQYASVVVENRPGAGGRIALQQVKRAAPDGQTVIVLPSGPMVLFPHVYKKLDYDAVNDFTPVSLIANFQFGVVAGPASQARTVGDMVKSAKAQPGAASYGTPGLGTLPHFMGVLFEQQVGAQLNHVPFQGGGPANTALLGGHIHYKFDVVSETAELHRTKKVRILAVTGATRDPQVPEVPTLKESGIDMVATAWFAMYGPAHMNPAVRDRLSQAVGAAVKSPALRERLLGLGYEPVGSTPAELAAAQAADLKRWQAPIKATGIQLD